jgi:hypothetical protein
MRRATKYEILRGVSATSRSPCIVQPSATPVRVAYLLDETAFEASGGVLEHHKTVFLEDSMHDWMWRDGVFYYFGHAMGMEEVGNIVAILDEEDCAAVTA